MRCAWLGSLGGSARCRVPRRGGSPELQLWDDFRIREVRYRDEPSRTVCGRQGPSLCRERERCEAIRAGSAKVKLSDDAVRELLLRLPSGPRETAVRRQAVRVDVPAFECHHQTKCIKQGPPQLRATAELRHAGRSVAHLQPSYALNPKHLRVTCPYDAKMAPAQFAEHPAATRSPWQSH